MDTPLTFAHSQKKKTTHRERFLARMDGAWANWRPRLLRATRGAAKVGRPTRWG